MVPKKDKRNPLYEGVWICPLLAVIYYVVSKLFLDDFYTSTVLLALAIITLLILLMVFLREGAFYGLPPEFRGILHVETQNPENEYFSLEIIGDLFELDEGDRVFFVVKKH